jgi:hypothetical protein
MARILNSDWAPDRAGFAFCKIGGKGSIARYREFFEAFKIHVFVIGDLDCLLDGFGLLAACDKCKAARDRLLAAADAYAKASGIQGRLSAGDLKQIVESQSRRERYSAMKAVYQKYLAGDAKLAEVEAAGEAFWGDETNKKRIAALEECADKGFVKLKHEVLRLLREHDVFVLERGAIEAYYPDGITGPDKPSRALAFCDRVQTRDQLLALCNSIPLDDKGNEKPEFEVIFGKVFNGS